MPAGIFLKYFPAHVRRVFYLFFFFSFCLCFGPVGVRPLSSRRWTFIIIFYWQTIESIEHAHKQWTVTVVADSFDDGKWQTMDAPNRSFFCRIKQLSWLFGWLRMKSTSRDAAINAHCTWHNINDQLNFRRKQFCVESIGKKFGFKRNSKCL